MKCYFCCEEQLDDSRFCFGCGHCVCELCDRAAEHGQVLHGKHQVHEHVSFEEEDGP